MNNFFREKKADIDGDGQISYQEQEDDDACKWCRWINKPALFFFHSCLTNSVINDGR